MSFTQDDVTFRHAIECRINAEDPKTFTPSPGTIRISTRRAGSACASAARLFGYRIPPYYDSLIGKLVVHGRNRNECLMRLRRTLRIRHRRHQDDDPLFRNSSTSRIS